MSLPNTATLALNLGLSFKFLHSTKSGRTFLASNYFCVAQDSDWGRDTNSERLLINDSLLSSIWHFFSDYYCSDLTPLGNSIVKISGNTLGGRPQIRTKCCMLYPTLLPAAAHLRCRLLARSGQLYFLSLTDCLAESPATLEYPHFLAVTKIWWWLENKTTILLKLLAR